jgi:hypothetical protein
MLARDEHSSLLRKFVTYGRIKFYKTGPRPAVYLVVAAAEEREERVGVGVGEGGGLRQVRCGVVGEVERPHPLVGFQSLGPGVNVGKRHFTVADAFAEIT